MSKQVTLEKMKFSYEYEPEVSVIRVIRTTLLERGKGTNKDPIRRIEQFWSLGGTLLFEIDPYNEE